MIPFLSMGIFTGPFEQTDVCQVTDPAVQRVIFATSGAPPPFRYGCILYTN